MQGVLSLKCHVIQFRRGAGMPSRGIVSRTVSSHGRAQAQKSCRCLDAWNTVISSSRTCIDISSPRPASTSDREFSVLTTTNYNHRPKLTSQMSVSLTNVEY
ncbi:hypothetical protein L798_07363 [Zootermopsis nevadensis]|uniref:Uncharacterized protein n=1 Tax=Zootermopsis nevadensis TaxID=136037 RepID=A0A067R5I4_ZOONE|nr:hypothetical protein L798_07363 [Zootermopsis nevadensis]